MTTALQNNTTASTAASSDAASAAVTAAVSGNGSTSQMFTTLLVAQIRNQNPLEPSDPSQFVTQLTQLSQMEALQKLATQGSASGATLQGLQTIALGAQVGAEITVTSDHVVLGSEPVSGHFVLANASAKTTLVLTAADGSEQRFELGTQAPGGVDFSLDTSTTGLPAGTYGLRVETASQETPSVELAGTLTRVRLSSGGSAVLDVAGVGEISPDSITGYAGRPTSTAP